MSERALRVVESVMRDKGYSRVLAREEADFELKFRADFGVGTREQTGIGSISTSIELTNLVSNGIVTHSSRFKPLFGVPTFVFARTLGSLKSHLKEVPVCVNK